MTTDTRLKIIEYVQKHEKARVHELVPELNLSHAAIHRQVKKLVSEGILQKVGTPPLVFYALQKRPSVKIDISFSPQEEKIITDNFLYITPDGKLLYGMEGFLDWAHLYQPKQGFPKFAHDYTAIIEEKRGASPKGWIDATAKIAESFPDTPITKLLFADIYSYPVFGRTKLAKLVMHSKQAENKALTQNISNTVKPIIERIIKTFHIDAVGFIPPTIPRPVQFMAEFEKDLALKNPKIDLVKVIPGDIPIAQKSLQSVGERLINAQESIYPKNAVEPPYQNVLLIDDVAGSGASFQETARKLRKIGVGTKSIIAFAIVGNLKGYDVIRQM